MKIFILSLLIAAGLIGSACAVNADNALSILKGGNTRFKSSASIDKNASQIRLDSVENQNPIAVIVTCSDSRTAPEIIFNKSLNRLFVVRTAGNVVDNIALGSIEYAVKALGVRLVVVMGHQNCGAVKAAIEGDNIPPHINSITKQIKPAVSLVRKQSGYLFANSIRANAIRVAEKIRHDAFLGDHAKDVKVVSAVYSLETGKVHWTE